MMDELQERMDKLQLDLCKVASTMHIITSAAYDTLCEDHPDAEFMRSLPCALDAVHDTLKMLWATASDIAWEIQKLNESAPQPTADQSNED